jgi:uncharacterized oligopeptide transporter (OPT) family protein
MSAEEIFSVYVRHIGIGGIACAGIIGILKSSGIIGGAMKLAWKEIAGGKALAQQSKNRMQKDLPMGVVAALILISILAILIFFYFGVVHNLWQAVVGLLIVIVISFLFTTVAARAIAIVGTNPVSGMTLMTLIISSVILVKVGLSGSTGMVSGGSSVVWFVRPCRWPAALSPISKSAIGSAPPRSTSKNINSSARWSRPLRSDW